MKSLDDLKQQVYLANMALVDHGLVKFTWGNVSGIDRDRGFVVIKPSGVSYDKLSPDQMVVVDLDGNVVEGGLRPSSDTPTHLAIYQAFSKVGGVVHTHSAYATATAQAGMSVMPLGTTHADYFHGEIPLTRGLTRIELNDYEWETGRLIAQTFSHIDPMAVPGVLVRNHGPFAWGTDATDAVHNAAVLEEAARLQFLTLSLNPSARAVSRFLSDKHYFRKHGANAYYGQLGL